MKLPDFLARGLARVYLAFKTKHYGSWLLPGSGVSPSWPWNWWQSDQHHAHHNLTYTDFGPIYACVSIISQDLSRIPLKHLRETENLKHETVMNAAPARIFRKPNRYQTLVDWLLYIARSLLTDGNAYCFAVYNRRNEVEELYPLDPRSVTVYVEPESKEIFYRISQSASSELAGDFENEFYPERFILHIRGQTPRHHLIGESPLVAAFYPTLAGTAIVKHTAHFFNNMTRPSGILKHPEELDDSAMTRLKARWKDLTTGPATGEPAILTEGMEWEQLQMNAVDAELAKSYSLSERQIFQIYRVPPFLGGDLEQATLNNVESLIRFYLQSCLGFYISQVEASLTRFFDLPPREKIVFDLEPALLRADIEQRLNALGKGVQNGIYAPNEARAKENLPPVEDGDQPRVQQQLVPLSYGIGLQPPGNTAPADPDPPPLDDDDNDDEGSDERSIEQVRVDTLKLLRERMAA